MSKKHANNKNNEGVVKMNTTNGAIVEFEISVSDLIKGIPSVLRKLENVIKADIPSWVKSHHDLFDEDEDMLADSIENLRDSLMYVSTDEDYVEIVDAYVSFCKASANWFTKRLNPANITKTMESAYNAIMKYLEQRNNDLDYIVAVYLEWIDDRMSLTLKLKDDGVSVWYGFEMSNVPNFTDILTKLIAKNEQNPASMKVLRLLCPNLLQKKAEVEIKAELTDILKGIGGYNVWVL